MFQMILMAIVVCTLAWWAWAHVWVGRLPRPALWRGVVALFVLVQVATLAWLFADRQGGPGMPTHVRAWAYVWHLVALPFGVFLGLIATAACVCRVIWDRFAARPPAAVQMPISEPGPDLTRRQVLVASAVSMPPLLCAAGVVKGLWELDEFRVRDIEVAWPDLPADLDGVSIAHVSDVHVGRYTRGRVLDEIATRVNVLRCDAIVMPGDLIDYALADLPEALAMVAKFDRPVYLCEGNHDLFQGREAFGEAVIRSGFRLLRNEAAVQHIRGVPVQFLGIRWGGPGSGRGARIEENLRKIEPLREPEAFQVLLAHHPHAFDGAAAMGIPLTLAGHTHGGQLMLDDNTGAGPMLFRYWSGLYQQAGPGGNVRSCVVSNGVGNWFPLRLNVPAEIVRVILRRA
jgi:predicted MPP superfamily phosphohydrolase